MTSRVSSKNKEKKAKRKIVFKKRDQIKNDTKKQKTAPTVNKVTSRPEVPTGRSII